MNPNKSSFVQMNLAEHKNSQARTSDQKNMEMPVDLVRNYNELSDETQMHDEYENNKRINQGTQGVQLQFQNIDEIPANIKDNNQYHPNNTETRALLNVEQSRFEVILQRLYYSPRCHYFYILLMISSIFLVVITVTKGFAIDKNPFFILFESIINLLIIGDYLCRIRLLGVKRFFKGGCWNIFDTIVVIGCVMLFFLILLSQSGLVLEFEELGEQILLVSWGLFQTLRIIFIAKKQKLAQQSAKTLIDFTNIIDTEVGGSMRRGQDEVIVFDMKQMEQKQRDQNQIVGGAHFRKRSRNSFKVNREIELPELDNNNQNQNENYSKQGLGGYEDEESLDGSARKEERKFE